MQDISLQINQSTFPEVDEYVVKARELLEGCNYLSGTADYCLAGYLRIKDLTKSQATRDLIERVESLESHYLLAGTKQSESEWVRKSDVLNLLKEEK